MSLVRYVRLRVPCANARPGPAIGQALGPLGINMAEFCKQFNEKSESMYEKDTPLTVQLAAMSDRSFTFKVHSPPTSYLIRRNLGIHNEKGPSEPNIATPSGYITPEAVYEIAKIKQQDDKRWHLPLEGIARSVEGTARSMGIVVREEQPQAEAAEATAPNAEGDGEKAKAKVDAKKGKKAAPKKK